LTECYIFKYIDLDCDTFPEMLAGLLYLSSVRSWLIDSSCKGAIGSYNLLTAEMDEYKCEWLYTGEKVCLSCWVINLLCQHSDLRTAYICMVKKGLVKIMTAILL